MVRAKCHNCGKKVRGGDDWRGRSGPCPNRQAVLSFPPAASPPSAPSRNSRSEQPLLSLIWAAIGSVVVIGGIHLGKKYQVEFFVADHPVWAFIIGAVTIAILLGLLMVFYLKIDPRRGWFWEKAMVVGLCLSFFGAILGTGMPGRGIRAEDWGKLDLVNTGRLANIVVYATLFWLFGASVGGFLGRNEQIEELRLGYSLRLRDLFFIVFWVAVLCAVGVYINKHAK